jgi:hypothetical protein
MDVEESPSEYLMFIFKVRSFPGGRRLDRDQKTFFAEENTSCLDLRENLRVCRGLAGGAEVVAAWR